MKLTRYTDYALRVLLYLGARPDRLCSISEMAKAYNISQNHLMKVVHDLGKAGFVVSQRGRRGGIQLSRMPAEIKVGAVVRHTEDGFDLVDCGNCIIAPACGMTGVLREALTAFMSVLDEHTLEDVLAKRVDMLSLFAPKAALGRIDMTGSSSRTITTPTGGGQGLSPGSTRLK